MTHPLRNVQLSGETGLQECILLGLGQINVLCGKNSSGKTTLLEAIHGLRGGTQEIHFSDAMLLSILAFIRTDVIENPHRWTEEAAAILLDNTRTATARARDIKEIARVIATGIRAWAAIRIRGDAQQLLEEFLRSFTAHQKSSILIPPKRQLETENSIQTEAKIQPAGEFLIQFLFRAKNDQEDSVEAKLLSRIKEEFRIISGGYEFDTFTLRGASNQIALRFSKGGGGWVDAKRTGLGLQDLLVVIYWALESTHDLVLIEEPESHLHPEWQRQLLVFLRERTVKQFILSTHSNVFINGFLVDKVFRVSFNRQINVEDATSRALLLTELGYDVTDNLVSDLTILVEGPSDVAVLYGFLAKMGLTAKYNIKFWPLGGDIMSQHDLSVLSEKYEVMAIVDKDPGSSRVRNKFVENCRSAGIPVTHLKRYSLENYFSVRALREVFGPQIPEAVEALDPEKSVESQLSLSVKKSNRRIVEAMSLDEIRDTDLDRFLKTVERKLTNAA